MGPQVRCLWHCCENIQKWNLASEEGKDRADPLRDSGLSSGLNDEKELTKHTGCGEQEPSRPRSNDMAVRKSEGAKGNDRQAWEDDAFSSGW